MSRKYYHWHNIECPFFRCDEALYITCEGAVDDTLNRLTFKNKEQRMDFEKKFCYSILSCIRCPVYKMIFEKYEAENIER